MITKKTKGLHEHWFFGSMLRQKKSYIQVIVASLFINIFALFSAFFVMTVYDRIIPNDAADSLIMLTLGILIVIFFDFLMKMVRGALTDRAGLEMDNEVGEKLFDLINQNEKLINTQPTGAVASTVKEFETLRDFMASATLVAFADFPFVVLFIFVLYELGGPIAAVPAIIVVSVIVVGLIIQPLIKRFSSNAQVDGQNKQSVLVEVINGLETLKVLRGVALFKNRWMKSVNEQGKSLGKSRFWNQFVATFAQFGQQLSQIGIVVYGVILIKTTGLTMGGLIACVILSSRALAPLGQISALLGRLNHVKAAFENLNRLFSNISDEESRKTYIRNQKIKGAISINNLEVVYENSKRPALAIPKLEIKPGEKVAVLGKIGSGKSTLIKLLCGLAERKEGFVKLGDMDINQMHPDDLRREVAVVLQSSMIFSGTLKENLLLGNPDATDEEIIEVGELTGVNLIAGDLPSGYDTHLAERGVQLSGGQRQAICIARAMLSDPAIVLMDEPTSAMDNQSETTLLNNIEPWLEGRTTLLVTHRGKLLDLVSRVIVFDAGKLIADGNKEDILRPAGK